MTIELAPDPDERILIDVHYQPSPKVYPFRLAVSDKHLYLSMRKAFVVAGNPNYIWRVPLAEVAEVGVRHIRPYGMYVLGVFMVLVGAWLLWMLTFIGAAASPRNWGWSAALFVGGLLLPFAARRRKRLVISIPNSKQKEVVWLPPLLVDRKSRRELDQTIENILHACAEVGVPIREYTP